VYGVLRRPNVVLSDAFEVPETRAVRFHNIMTICLGQYGEITNLINDTGPPAAESTMRQNASNREMRG